MFLKDVFAVFFHNSIFLGVYFMYWLDYLFIGIGIVLAICLVNILLYMPSGKRRKKRRAKQVPLEPIQKDWQATAQRLEKHIYAIRQKIALKEKVIIQKDKQIVLERVKVTKLQDQLNQASQWQKKEQDNFGKMTSELKANKAELIKVQDQYAKAHGQNIELNKQLSLALKDTKKLAEEKRDKELEHLHLQEKYESIRGQSVKLKRENAELLKKKDDATWIAKSEYLILERKLKEKEKQFERLDRELRKER